MQSNINEVIQNKSIINQTPFFINGNTGEAYYEFCGMKVSEKLLKDMYPTEVIYHNPKGEGKDRRTNFY